MMHSEKEIHEKIRLLIDSMINLKDEDGKYTLDFGNGLLIDQISFDFWEWISGIGMYGMMKYHRQTGDEYTLGIIKDWFKRHLTPEMEADKNINTMVQMLTLSYLYEETKEEKYLSYIEKWAEWLYNDLPRTACGGFEHMTFGPRHYEEMWDDTLMMSAVTLAKIGILLDKKEYIEEAKYQFLVHTHYLADRITGLWYHGWHCKEKHNYAKALWGRGNSWITISIPELLDLLELPEYDAFARYMKLTLKNQIASVAEYQSENGLWHTLINNPDSYLESSATAGFTYGIFKAVNAGVIEEKYLESALKGVEAVIRCINPDGSLALTSIGTGLSHSLNEYLNKPIAPVPFGQAMGILALCEYLEYIGKKEL